MLNQQLQEIKHELKTEFFKRISKKPMLMAIIGKVIDQMNMDRIHRQWLKEGCVDEGMQYAVIDYLKAHLKPIMIGGESLHEIIDDVVFTVMP